MAKWTPGKWTTAEWTTAKWYRRPVIALGIDAGGSSTRWLLSEDGRELGRGSVATRSGPLYTDESRRETFARFQAVARGALAQARPQRVLAGVTGLDEGNPAAEELRGVLSDALELPLARVRVVNDMQIAYRSVFEPEEGVLVYAGTGSIACCELENGSLLRVGGHGYLIDDAGGGFWIGQQALRTVLRDTDLQRSAADSGGQAQATAGKGHGAGGGGRRASLLAVKIYEALGTSDWPAIRAAVYGGGRGQIAALAPAVGAAAATGDEPALEILRAAGRELARLVLVIASRLERSGGPLPVAFSGGITRLGAPLTDALRSALPAGAHLAVVDVEPVEAAARLALGSA
jgi:glucosamine kinase